MVKSLISLSSLQEILISILVKERLVYASKSPLGFSLVQRDIKIDSICLLSINPLIIPHEHRPFADLFLFCYERDFMLSLSDNNQTDIIEAFNSTFRYLDELLNIDNPYFEQMEGQIYTTELQINKANSSDTEAPFLNLNLSITNLA